MSAVARPGRSLAQLPSPAVGLDTNLVLDHAVVDLADRRFLTRMDATTQLHLLASLLAQAEVWLGEQVAIARGGGMPWAAIGRLLGVSAAVARQRYQPPTNGRRRSRPTEEPPLAR